MRVLYVLYRVFKIERGHGAGERAVHEGGRAAFHEHLSDHGTETIARHAVGAYAQYDGQFAEAQQRAVEFEVALRVRNGLRADGKCFG